MADTRIYRDIAERTGGNVYVGVVGPVRTGKSTFIKRFMESLVLPNISDGYKHDRARDELPQSAAGKTVMTTEPKFIPEEAVEINPFGSGKLRVRMIDCVGYLVPDAIGTMEDGKPRLVRTPWSEQPVPFSVAAEEGTRRVICEHSTVGIVVTCDGTISEIARGAYEEAEERIISELKSLGKPFVIVLNSARPSSKEAIALGNELEAKYNVPVALVNCLELDGEDIKHILEMILNEFAITEIRFSLPQWTLALSREHRLMQEVNDIVTDLASKITKICELNEALKYYQGNEIVESIGVDEINMGNGRISLTLEMNRNLFYDILREESGFDIGCVFISCNYLFYCADSIHYFGCFVSIKYCNSIDYYV